MKYFTKLLLASACAISIQMASADAENAEHDSMLAKASDTFHEYVVAPIKNFFTRMEGVDDDGKKVEEPAAANGADALKNAKDANPPAVVGEHKDAKLTHEEFEKVIDAAPAEKKEDNAVAPAVEGHHAVKNELQKQEELQDLKDGSRTLTDVTNAEKPEAKEPLKDEAEIAQRAEADIKAKIEHSENKPAVVS